MFTSHDGRFVYVSRPSLADVVGHRPAPPARSSGASRWRASARTTWASRRTAPGCWSRTRRRTRSTCIDPLAGEKVGEFESGDSPHESNYTKDGSQIFHASIGLVYTPTDQPAARHHQGRPLVFQVVDAAHQRGRRAPRHRPRSLDASTARRPRPDSSAVRPMAIAPDEKTAYLQLSFFHGFVEFDLRARQDHRGSSTCRSPRRRSDCRASSTCSTPPTTASPSTRRARKLCAAGTMSDYAAIVPSTTSRHDRLVDGSSKPYWSTNSADGRYCFVSASGADEVVVIDYATETGGRRASRVGDHPQRMRIGVIRTELLRAARRCCASALRRAEPPAPAAPAPDAPGRRAPGDRRPAGLLGRRAGPASRERPPCVAVAGRRSSSEERSRASSASIASALRSSPRGRRARCGRRKSRASSRGHRHAGRPARAGPARTRPGRAARRAGSAPRRRRSAPRARSAGSRAARPSGRGGAPGGRAAAVSSELDRERVVGRATTAAAPSAGRARCGRRRR